MILHSNPTASGDIMAIMKLSAKNPEHVEAAIDQTRNAVRGMVIMGQPAPTTYHHIADGVERIGSLTGLPYIEISQYKNAAGQIIRMVVAETETRDSRSSGSRQKAAYAYDTKDPKKVNEAMAIHDSFVIEDSDDPEPHFNEAVTHDSQDARKVILAVSREINERARPPRRKQFAGRTRRKRTSESRPAK